MNKKRRTDRWQLWRGRMEAWQASGLIQSEFCRQQGIEHKHFSLWKRKLTTDRPTANENCFVEVPFAGTKARIPTTDDVAPNQLGRIAISVRPNEIVITLTS